MAREIISAQGPNSYDVTNGQMNFIVNGVVTGGPQQDIFDQQTANIADVFLGISHLNCLLCHNGAGPSDGPEPVGRAADALQRLGHGGVPVAHQHHERAVSSTASNPRYWGVADTSRRTTSSTRPPAIARRGSPSAPSPAFRPPTSSTARTPQPARTTGRLSRR